MAAAPFKLELLVQGRQLKLVDFGTATLNGSHVLCSGVPDTLRAHALAPEPYRVSSDARIIDVLDALQEGAEVVRQLEAHGAADVRLGVCPFCSALTIEELPLIEVRNCTGIPAHAKAWQYCGAEQRHRLRKDAPNMMEASSRAHHASLKKWARRS